MPDAQTDVWPFPERRYPVRSSPDYLGFKGLTTKLQAVIAAELAGKKDLDVVDVGCGHKPFYPFFRPLARSFIGTDIIKDNPLIDRVCPAEALDVADESADVVLCFSVLEHVNDPAQAVRELRRIVRPKGVVFASTHGCFLWHPYPQDHWRWTQTGLQLLFTQHAGFRSAQISSTRGSMSGIFFLLSHWIYSGLSRSRPRRLVRRMAVPLVNRLGEIADDLTPGLHDVGRADTAIPEFFVVARK